MGEQKHSPEPWRLIADYPTRIRANPEKTRRGPPVAICDNTHGLGDAALTDEANARRIVACVNACADIPTEELEAATLHAAGLVLEQGWRGDMENAPEYVDLLVKGPPYARNEHGIWVAVRTKYGWQGCSWGVGRDFRPDDEPTAWRALPAPPESKEPA